jgi:hypothetical protein
LAPRLRRALSRLSTAVQGERCHREGVERRKEEKEGKEKEAKKEVEPGGRKEARSQ